MLECALSKVRDFIKEHGLLSVLDLGENRVQSIYDSFGHLASTEEYIDVVTYYKLLNSGVRAVKVYRRPIVGILHNVHGIGVSLKYFMDTLNILSMYLGLIRDEKDIYRSLKISDVLLVGADPSLLKDRGVKIVKLPWIRFSDVYVCAVDRSLIVVSSDGLIPLLASVLYFIRFYLNVVYRCITLLYPIEYLGTTTAEEFNVMPVDENMRFSIEEGGFVGYVVTCGGVRVLEKIRAKALSF